MMSLVSVKIFLIGFIFLFLLISFFNIPKLEVGPAAIDMLGLFLPNTSRTRYLLDSIIFLSNFLNLDNLSSCNLKLNSSRTDSVVKISFNAIFAKL